MLLERYVDAARGTAHCETQGEISSADYDECWKWDQRSSGGGGRHTPDTQQGRRQRTQHISAS